MNQGILTVCALVCLAAIGCNDSERSKKPSADRSDAGRDSGVVVESPSVDAATGDPPHSRRIADENRLPGTTSWRLFNPARHHEVEGYASQVSAVSGDRVQLRVNVDKPKPVHWELYRMGYYQGLGARFVSSSPERQIAPQDTCAVDDESALVECNWDAAFEVPIAASWITGQYFFKLIDGDGHDSYVSLVVREAVPQAPILFQSSITTWQAYNRFGGSSLYRNDLPEGSAFTRAHADAVSFNRPYGCSADDSDTCVPGAGNFEQGERWLAAWFEQHGIELAYATTVDVATDASLLEHRKLFMSVGHDEYWTISERDHIEHARDEGLSLAFITANTGYWRIRLAPSSQGDANRTMICYKDGARDPVQGAETTDETRNEPGSRPEDMLIGIMYDDHISKTYYDGFAQVVRNQDHWIYRGTGVRNGDIFTHVTGREWDRVLSSARSPTSIEVVAHAEALNNNGRPIAADVTLYYPTPTSLVFSAGSLIWGNGFGQPGYADPRIQRMMENILVRIGITGFDMTEVPSLPNIAPEHPVAAFAGTGIAGEDDGAAMEAQFDAPTGLALGDHGDIYVTDAARNSIRVMSSDGRVSTLAGCGGKGRVVDGDGSNACFNNPTAIVRASSDTFYVTDTLGQRIRSVTTSGHVTTLAGNGHGGRVDSPDPLKAEFSEPRGLAIGPDGALYIAEGGTGLIRKLDKTGVSTVIEVVQPTGIAVTADNTLYVVDTRNATIVRVQNGSRNIIAGAPGVFGDRDGAAGEARLRPGEGIVVEGDKVIFADTANHKVRALSLSDGSVTTVAGLDGTTTELELPRFLLSTPRGLLIADSGHHRLALLPAATH